MSAFKIEQNVPVPNTGIGRHGTNERRSYYPFPTMEIGESFFVASINPQNIRGAAHRWGRVLGRKFVTRVVNDGIRCWRVK